MPFVVVGIEHKTAPLSIRERALTVSDALKGTDSDLRSAAPVDEFVVLSTCNRTEIYMFGDDPDAAAATAASFFKGLDEQLTGYLIRRDEMDVAEHLFRVAAGLESQTLGEAQVLGQVREALHDAQTAGRVGPNLNALFRAAIACGRRARMGTALGRINPSVASEAVKMAAAGLQGLAGKKALLVGGGEIIRLAAAELRAKGIDHVFVANRTDSVAQEIAEIHDAKPVRLDSVGGVLGQVDLLLSATAARGYILRKTDFGDVDRRFDHPLVIYDLAIPRDVDPAVRSVPGVRLHDLDSVLPETTDQQWQEDIRAIEATIAAELHDFQSWVLVRRVVPVITNLRAHVEAVSAQELKRVEPQLRELSERERQAVESLTSRLVDKMFHHLVMRLRLAAQTDPKLVEAAEFFFLHGEGGLFPSAADIEAVPDEAEKR